MENDVTQKIDEILEIVRFIKDNGATQESVDNLEVKFTGLDNKVTGLDNKVTGLDNKVTGLDNKMEQGFADIKTELREIRQDLEQIKTDLAILEKRTREDVDATGENYFSLAQRLKHLEAKVRRLELARG